ncbi:unnamed protein product [Cladocopium goreaui]|uniref:Uncharacterized protein n=1 Tax=Cladocopium goreaui TaxID=2562237 RepID=A0A9P1GED0_9DINO|nr:unnamed protein product [Cladocopium goreaui]
MSDDRLQDWEREAINSYLSWKGGKGPIPYVNPTAKGDGKGDGKANPKGEKGEKGESMCKGGKGDGKHGKNPEGAKAPGPGPPPGKGSMRPPEPVTKGSASSAPPPLGAVSATPSSTGIRPKQRPPAGSWVSAWLWLPSGTVLGSLPGTPGPPPAAPPPAAALPRDESSSSQDRVVFLAGAESVPVEPEPMPPPPPRRDHDHGYAASSTAASHEDALHTPRTAASAPAASVRPERRDHDRVRRGSDRKRSRDRRRRRRDSNDT